MGTKRVSGRDLVALPSKTFSGLICAATQMRNLTDLDDLASFNCMLTFLKSVILDFTEQADCL